MKSASLIKLIFPLTILSGCDGLRVEQHPLGSYNALFGEADTRMILAAPTRIDPYGKNVPTQITCAEPSPDVAKAISTAFGAGGAVTVNVNGAPGTPAQVGEAAAAVSKSRAEAIAQLGERMASIQLLRDGLFRACEAYQNGALSPASYALVLSRYGDTMVTMLGSELIAGEFGRSGAAISGSANGSGSASLGQQATVDAAKAADAVVSSAEDDLATKQSQLVSDRLALDQLNNAPAANPPSADTLLTAKQKVATDEVAVRSAQTKLGEAKQAAAGAKSAAASSAAQASGEGIGGLKITPQEHAANRIADLVRGYMSTPTIHSIMTACIATLEDNVRANTNFGDFCRQSMGGFSLALREGYEKSINTLAQTNADAERRELADRIKRLQSLLGTVKTAVDTPPKPAPKKPTKKSGAANVPASNQ